MDEPKRLRGLHLDELAAEMSGVHEGSAGWSKYVAEFKRRAAAQQQLSSIVAMCSLVVSAVAIVAGSAVTVREHIIQVSPPAEDLAVMPKPLLDPTALQSEAAGDRYDIAIEAWGEHGWAQVARLCRFHREVGMKGLDCPPPAAPPRPG